MEPLFDSLKFLSPNDRRLNTVSREITGTDFKNGTVDKIAGVMLDIAMSERGDEQPEHQRPILVGLAAPQIGAFVRMILWDSKAQAGTPNPEPEFKVIVNPRLIRVSDEQKLEKEACYSTGDIRAMVYRSTSLVLGGVNAEHNKSEATLINDPFQARIIQHEIDHLDGIRCPDRVQSPYHLLSTADEIYGPAGVGVRWTRYVPVETWMNMKHGDRQVQ